MNTAVITIKHEEKLPSPDSGKGLPSSYPFSSGCTVFIVSMLEVLQAEREWINIQFRLKVHTFRQIKNKFD